MLIIENIAELVCVRRGPITGPVMDQVPRIADAAVVIDEDRIAWFGRQADLDAPAGAARLDAARGCVVPGLIDCHTHTVFAGSRADEFVARIRGRTYAEIAEDGGGIVVTVDAVRAATRDVLVDLALGRLRRMLARGVTSVEIKSGYGLTVADELKMLEAVEALGSLQPIELFGTYLAAHTVPREFRNRGDDYLDLVLHDDVLGAIRDRRLASFCDVFCERGAYSVEQSRRVLESAKRFGLRPKVHADQITAMGASRLAAEVGAVSADHLEHIDDESISAMRSSGTIAVLLPGCSFFLGVGQAPARRMMDAGLAVAVATDFNPGSSMIESLPMVMHIACTQLRMTPTEALVAATANAAAALDQQWRLGAIERDMQADLLVLDAPNVDQWMYEPGRNLVGAVIKRGRLVHDSHAAPADKQ